MRTLTVSECIDWIKTVGLNADPDALRVSLPGHDAQLVFTVRWPRILPYQVPYFASLLLPGNPSEIDECVFLLSDNGACGVLDFELASRMLGLLRDTHDEKRAPLDSPAYVLSRGDSVDARMLVTMALLFSWDCYIVPQHGRFFVWIDDDEAADVWCKTREDYGSLVAKFKKFGIVPEEAPEIRAGN